MPEDPKKEPNVTKDAVPEVGGFKKGYFVLSEEIIKELKKLEVPSETRESLKIPEKHFLVYIMACTPGKKKKLQAKDKK